MRFCLYIFLLFFPLLIYAGGENQQVGARQFGMANTSVTLSDVFAINYNIAGIAYTKDTVVGLYIDRRFLLAKLNFMNVSAVMPVQQIGSFGVSVDYFGNARYNESKIGLGYARVFGDKVALGLKMNYLRIAIEENGARSTLGFDVGLQVRPIDKLRVAAHIYNPIPFKLENQYKEKLSTTLKIGMSYHPNEKAIVAIEVEKEINHDFRLKTGMEYRILKPLVIRLGAATNPTLFTFGVGTYYKGLYIDFASSWHLQLGYSPQFALRYVIGKKGD